MGFADAYLMESERSLLIVVDPQTKFMNVLFEGNRVRQNIRKLIAAAHICGVPVLVTTQNAEKLGPMDDALTELLPDAKPIDKMTFSCMGNSEFRRALEEHLTGRRRCFAGSRHMCASTRPRTICWMTGLWCIWRRTRSVPGRSRTTNTDWSVSACWSDDLLHGERDL